MSKLEEIFKNKRSEVEASKRILSIEDLKSKCMELPATLGFLDALRSSPNPISLIAEVKAKSPSAGTIRPNFNPAKIAAAYKRSGAECLSVLTDRTYFGGDQANIELCKSASGLPVLRKDFIDDPYQIYEARVWGADAILLIVAALETAQIVDLSEIGKCLGLDVLVEVHNEEEANIALECRCDFVGVNNRDLSTFQTDLATSEALLPMLIGCFRVSESAISTYLHVDRVRKAGADAVLVGTAFCESNDIEAKVREIMGR